MTNPDSPVAPTSCSFCSKTREEVSQLIAAVAEGVAICNECVMMAADIIIKHQGKLVELNGKKNVELRQLRTTVAELTTRLAGRTQQREEVASELRDKILGVLAQAESATDSIDVTVDQEA